MAQDHIVRTANVKWVGDVAKGHGDITTASGKVSASYSFGTRFSGDPGTNPEELIAASHAGCFTMALSLMLGEAGFVADEMNTSAKVTLEQVADGFAITASHLTLTAKIPKIDQATFDSIVAKAKAGCPVSKVLKAEITLDAKLG